MGGRRRRGLAALRLATVGCTALLVASAPAFPAAAGAAPEWHLGTLTFARCEIGGDGSDGLPSEAAWCTHVEVPEDWRTPGSRRIALHVALIRAEAVEPDADVVSFLDGGPGGAATRDYAAEAAAFAPLAEHHDVLLLDQRGTGGSNALRCPALDGLSSHATGPPGGTAQSAPTLQQTLRDCLAQLSGRASPADYTTSEAVRDLEAVREAIGAPALDLIAVSYGTRVAQEYLRRYPRAVRSLVLDSPVPPTRTLLSDQAVNLQRALRADFALCTQSPACARRFDDPYATLHRLYDALALHPAMVQLRDPVTYAPAQVKITAEDLADVVRLDAYSSVSAALLPLMLHAAAQGDYAALLGQKRWLADDLGDQITSAVQLSVLCAEDVDLARPDRQAVGTLLGNAALLQTQSACRVWPHGWRPADFHSPVRSSVPTLILSGALDPVTPPAWGQEIRGSLSDARALLVPGQAHAVMGAGCMPQLLRRFVEHPDPASLDASCLARLVAPAPFLDYNGAGP